MDDPIRRNLRPRQLEGYSPPPTGTTHVITVTKDEFDEILQLTQRADQCQRWGDEEGLGAAREALRLHPAMPKGALPGDHYVIRLAPRTQVQTVASIGRLQ